MTDEDEWKDWIDVHGGHGVLQIPEPAMLPPGLQEALEFGRFGLFFPEVANPTVAVDQGAYVEVRVNAGLASETTNEAGIIRRVLRTGGTVDHLLFSLPRLLWNQGNGRDMLRHAVELYDELGVEDVRLKAVGLGKYMWAAAGFDFTDDETRESVNTAMSLFATELGLTEELPRFHHSWDVLALDKDSDGTPFTSMQSG